MVCCRLIPRPYRQQPPHLRWPRRKRLITFSRVLLGRVSHYVPLADFTARASINRVDASCKLPHRFPAAQLRNSSVALVHTRVCAKTLCSACSRVGEAKRLARVRPSRTLCSGMHRVCVHNFRVHQKRGARYHVLDKLGSAQIRRNTRRSRGR